MKAKAALKEACSASTKCLRGPARDMSLPERGFDATLCSKAFAVPPVGLGLGLLSPAATKDRNLEGLEHELHGKTALSTHRHDSQRERGAATSEKSVPWYSDPVRALGRTCSVQGELPDLWRTS